MQVSQSDVRKMRLPSTTFYQLKQLTLGRDDPIDVRDLVGQDVSLLTLLDIASRKAGPGVLVGIVYRCTKLIEPMVKSYAFRDSHAVLASYAATGNGAWLQQAVTQTDEVLRAVIAGPPNWFAAALGFVSKSALDTALYAWLDDRDTAVTCALACIGHSCDVLKSSEPVDDIMREELSV